MTIPDGIQKLINEMEADDAYWVKLGDASLGSGWIEVSRETWVHYERSCGFYPKYGLPDHPATGGFVGQTLILGNPVKGIIRRKGEGAPTS